MDQLYPIIRRARRPLIVNDAPSVFASKGDAPTPPKPEPVASVGGVVSGESPDKAGESPALPEKASDAKVSRKRSAR